MSRNEYALEALKKINGKLEFKSLVEALADSRKVNVPDDIAPLINEIIKHDGYKLEKDDSDIFIVTGKELNDLVAIDAHFHEIKSQIVDSIRNSKFLIWVAVAWFTNKDLNKVIHGSYNWTSNAQYNNKSITITEGREVAEDFANQFIQLRNQIGN